MKSMSSLLACAIGLAIVAAPALSQQTDPWLTQDGAFINQLSGTENIATIEQVASQGGNIVEIYQGEHDTGGNGNAARVFQQNVGQSIAYLHQGGYQNESTIMQHDGAHLEARVNVDSGWNGDSDGQANIALVDQSGFDSLARIEQGHSSFSQAEIRQAGSSNGAEILQFGNSNHAAIAQSGSFLSAAIRQEPGSYGNTATIRQGY